MACCDVVNRGAAYADGTIFFNTLDVQTIAVDATTGKRAVEDASSATSTAARPSPWRRWSCEGKVLVGNSGGEFGVRGWLTALDAATGKIAWRAYSTGPDKDVLIGPRFKPFYAQDRGKDLGVHTWPPEQWKIGGGTVWGWISYDPELDLRLLRHRQSRPVEPGAAAGRQQVDRRHLRARPGHRRGALVLPDRARTTCSTTTASTSRCCSTCDIGGRTRKVLVRPERNGYIYVIDRATGEVLSADALRARTRRATAWT